MLLRLSREPRVFLTFDLLLSTERYVGNTTNGGLHARVNLSRARHAK